MGLPIFKETAGQKLSWTIICVVIQDKLSWRIWTSSKWMIVIVDDSAWWLVVKWKRMLQLSWTIVNYRWLSWATWHAQTPIKIISKELQLTKHSFCLVLKHKGKKYKLISLKFKNLKINYCHSATDFQWITSAFQDVHVSTSQKCTDVINFIQSFKEGNQI